MDFFKLKETLSFFFIFFLLLLNTLNTYSQRISKDLIDELIINSENTIYTNIDSSNIYIEKALLYATNVNYKEGIARAKKQMGLIRYFEVNFTEALNLFIESNLLFKELDNIEGQSSALNLIAVIYSDQGRNVEALEIYNQILNIVEPDNYKRLSATYNNIGVTYRDLGDQLKCYSYYLKAFKTIQNVEELDSESQFSNNIGMLFIQMGQADSALFYLKYGLQLALKINNYHRISNSYEGLGDYYYWQKNNDEALKNYQLAYEFAEKINIVYEISSTARGLSKTYEALGDIKNAYHYLNIQKIMDDSVKQKEIASYITQIELEKKFQKERELNAAINAKSKLIRNIYFIVILAVITIAGLLLFGFYQKRRAYNLLEEQTNKVIAQNSEIQNQTEQLTSLISLKDKLFSIISHDLRSPLVSLITLLNVTKNENFTKEQFFSYINETIDNVNYTTTLVDNLLRWASSQQKGMTIKPMQNNLNDIIQGQLFQFNIQCNQKNILILNEVPENIEVNADEDMLRIIVRNLISNAIKFSNQGEKIFISAYVSNKMTNLLIEDTGIGMSEKLVSQLFHTSLESKRGTNNEKGTGLGLLLCKDFIELNGGTISVKSVLGKGSTFHVVLPTEITDKPSSY